MVPHAMIALGNILVRVVNLQSKKDKLECRFNVKIQDLQSGYKGGTKSITQTQ